MGAQRRLLLLLLVSLTLRMGAVGVMDLMHARPAPEEADVMLRAAAPSSSHDPAPLYPRWLALTTREASRLEDGRLWNAMLGVFATYLVLRFARRMVDRRSAWAAAWIHALHPTALFFGASLRAEPMTIVLMLMAADTAMASREVQPGWGRRRRAALAGVMLGLLVLTSRSMLPWLVVLPLMMMGTVDCWRGRRLAALLLGAAALAVMLPWGSGPSSGFDAAPSTVADGLGNLRTVWAADLAPTRHAAAVFHRPVPTWAGAARWAVQVALWLWLTSLVIKGFLRRETITHPRYLLLLAAAGSLGAAWMAAGPEAHHPLLILLLPAAGAGWAKRHESLSMPRQLKAAALMGGVAWLTTGSLAGIIETRLMPSEWARPWVEPVARAAGAHPVYADVVELRNVGGVESVIVEASPNLPPIPIVFVGDRAVTFLVHADEPHRKAYLIIRASTHGTDIIIDPVDPDWWGRWRGLDALGLNGLELRWKGSGPSNSQSTMGRKRE